MYSITIEEEKKNVTVNIENGRKGEPFRYEDFTPEQLEDLKVKGDPFRYEDFTPEQLEALKVKGDPFRYEDFTPEQLEQLKGDEGLSAFEVWQQQNPEGTYDDYMQSLRVYQVVLTQAEYDAITPDPNTFYFII